MHVSVSSITDKDGGEHSKIGAVTVDDGAVASTSIEALDGPEATSVAGSIGSSMVEPVVPSSQASVDMEDVEYDSETESVSLFDIGKHGDLCSLEEINDFLDKTSGKSVKVTGYFQDTNKCIQTVTILQKVVGYEVLDEKKRFRLKKHVTALRKTVKASKGKRLKKVK